MRRFVGIITGFVFFAAAIWAFLNYQLIIDHVVASQFKPSTSVIELEKQVKFSDQGSFLFRATQPTLDDSASFNAHCQQKDEHSVVLGCYIGPQQIYIYDVQDSRLSGIRQVTAAHEMLHAAYDRLPASERKTVNRMVENALPGVLQSSTDLAARLEIYEKTEPGQRLNELHSILGTEAESLPLELENYYKQYFKDRSVITAYAKSYSQVFSDLKTNQETVVNQLKALSDEIDRLSVQYNSEAEQLQNNIDAFNSRASMDDGFSSQAEFDQEKAALSLKINQLESLRQLINDKVGLYEQKRAELEALNVQVAELNSKLDSTTLPSL